MVSARTSQLRPPGHREGRGCMPKGPPYFAGQSHGRVHAFRRAGTGPARFVLPGQLLLGRSRARARRDLPRLDRQNDRRHAAFDVALRSLTRAQPGCRTCPCSGAAAARPVTTAARATPSTPGRASSCTRLLEQSEFARPERERVSGGSRASGGRDRERPSVVDSGWWRCERSRHAGIDRRDRRPGPSARGARCCRAHA